MPPRSNARALLVVLLAASMLLPLTVTAKAKTMSMRSFLANREYNDVKLVAMHVWPKDTKLIFAHWRELSKTIIWSDGRRVTLRWKIYAFLFVKVSSYNGTSVAGLYVPVIVLRKEYSYERGGFWHGYRVEDVEIFDSIVWGAGIGQGLFFDQVSIHYLPRAGRHYYGQGGASSQGSNGFVYVDVYTSPGGFAAIYSDGYKDIHSAYISDEAVWAVALFCRIDKRQAGIIDFRSAAIVVMYHWWRLGGLVSDYEAVPVEIPGSDLYYHYDNYRDGYMAANGLVDVGPWG